MMRIGFLISFLFLVACTEKDIHHNKPGSESISLVGSQDLWNEYWYSGNAEISVYDVEQARYNHVHPGKTILVFVTEDFLTDKQVKSESSQKNGSTSVLKTNLIRKFNTGMYDYSIMSSVFTPVDRNRFPQTLKVTTTSQDWCGHSFMQYNLRNNQYTVKHFSYFEDEGDQSYKVKAIINEDELFNLIRLNPGLLPTGRLNMLPGSIFCRLKHQNFKETEVVAENNVYSGIHFEGDDLQLYKVTFPAFSRTLEIVYHRTFPYPIEGWMDTYPNFSGEKVTSISKKETSIRSPYWSKHNPEDSLLRTQLGL